MQHHDGTQTDWEVADAASVSLYLKAMAERAGEWLKTRRYPNGPGFSLCGGALVPVEINATTGGVELWTMLGLPLSETERTAWIEHLRAYQAPATGLVIDSTWRSRQITPDEAQLIEGDSFFTMSATAALEALGAAFEFPIAYLAELSVDELARRISLPKIAHYRFGVGDAGRLIRHNVVLGVPNAQAQWDWLNDMLVDSQDETGLWPRGQIAAPYTPAINRAFHVLRSTWNLAGRTIPHADRAIDLCLKAAEDDDFYGWGKGYACNDLDLAQVAYSALVHTDHRRDELAAWARRTLGQILAVEKLGGGFSFYHETAMEKHGGLRMSEQRPEADTWGTLMYLGAIKMMVEIGWHDAQVPWSFSKIHAVPQGGLK